MRVRMHNIIMSTLTTGSAAPKFNLSSMGDDGPEMVSLDSALQNGPVVLLFVPAAFTSVCSTELCEVTASYSEYEALGASVLGISGDSPFAQAAWAEKEGIKLRLLSDYDHSVARAYGVAYDSFLPEKNLPLSGVSKRSAFVIAKDGTVAHAEVLESPGDMPDFAKVKAALEGLR